MSAVPKVGQRVRTQRDGRAWWTVQAAGKRYAICSRQAPFGAKGEYLYTIMDFERGIQGPCNLIGNGWDVTQYKTPEIGWRALHLALLGKQVEISHRNNINLEVTEVADWQHHK